MIDQHLADCLAIQQEKLMQMAERSDQIEVEVVNPKPGWPAKEYLITYRCKGIARIDETQTPEYAEFHRMEMVLSDDYPNAEPSLIFLTPIWHPNISSTVPRRVCTDNVNSWWVGKGLDELVEIVGEMIQYKKYHAEWTPPFPKDLEVAQWVRDFAEPRQIVGKENPVDDQTLRRPYQISQADQSPVEWQPAPDLASEPDSRQTNKIMLGLPAGLKSEADGQPQRITLGQPKS